MPEASIAAVILVPLALLTYVAIQFLRLGMASAELTDEARQRLTGIGMFLFYIVTVMSVVFSCTGGYCLLRVLRL